MPAYVDDRSGYRLYGEDQVKHGAIVRALRAAGVGLGVIAGVCDLESAASALAAHRTQVLANRILEDQAFAAVSAELDGLGQPLEIVERSLPPQPYVGRVLTVTPDHPQDLDEDAANQAFGALYGKLRRAGLGPSGRFWTTIRSTTSGTVELVGCWPTAEVVPESFCDPAEISDALPARTELVAVWQSDTGVELPAGATHPAVIGLFEALAQRDVSLRNTNPEVRQFVLSDPADQTGQYVVEVAVTLPQV